MRLREKAAVAASDRLTHNTQRDLDARHPLNLNKTVDAPDSVEPFGDTLKYSLDNDEDYILTIKAMASIMRNHSCACNCQVSRDTTPSDIFRTAFWTFVGFFFFCTHICLMNLNGSTDEVAAACVFLPLLVATVVAFILSFVQMVKDILARL
ncbi:hypothetical protein F5X68DRAFT_275549 [Plectosphaerella plurivora]|uniref:Uncharacterized protein n=1 Tax=Plectosphaerella plurivora TaxID=936078 RepID=A0A9P9A8W2_9PEZI|nr:hypothetical protein F5X68DRAFT_275549 [Plectosphaerella plurivora]